MGNSKGRSIRLKVIERLDYDRVRVDLLRQRILHRMTAPMLPVKQRRRGGQRALA